MLSELGIAISKLIGRVDVWVGFGSCCVVLRAVNSTTSATPSSSRPEESSNFKRSERSTTCDAANQTSTYVPNRVRSESRIACHNKTPCGLQPASCLDFTGRRDNVCGWALNIYWHNLLCVDFLVESDLNSVLSFECRIMPRASPWRNCKVCSFIAQRRQSAPLTLTGEALTETVLIRVVETFLILKRIDCVIVKDFDRAIGHISEPGTLRNFSTNVNLSALLIILVISKKLFSYAGICFVRGLRREPITLMSHWPSLPTV